VSSWLFSNRTDLYEFVSSQKLRQVYQESIRPSRSGSSLQPSLSAELDTISQERRTLKRQATVRSKKGSGWDTVDGQVVILRSVFSVNYPQLLVEVTTAMDESMAASMRPKDHTHVDISFKDLSLAVQVAGQQINVVDQVTGRLKSQTMTALMGGSGAGTYVIVLYRMWMVPWHDVIDVVGRWTKQDLI
jgi:hypothetical protein